MKIYLVFACVFLFSGITFSQSADCPKVTNNSRDIASVSGFNSDLTDCSTARLDGVIVGFEYAEDTDTAPSAIVIQTVNGSREAVYFTDDDFTDCFSEADKGNWKAQLVKGARVSVEAFACGTGGKRDLSISSISFRARRSSVQRERSTRKKARLNHAFFLNFSTY